MQQLLYLAGLLGITRPEVKRRVEQAQRNTELIPSMRLRLRRQCIKEGIDLTNPDVFLPWPLIHQLTVPNGIELVPFPIRFYDFFRLPC